MAPHQKGAQQLALSCAQKGASSSERCWMSVWMPAEMHVYHTTCVRSQHICSPFPGSQVQIALSQHQPWMLLQSATLILDIDAGHTWELPWPAAAPDRALVACSTVTSWFRTRRSREVPPALPGIARAELLLPAASETAVSTSAGKVPSCMPCIVV